MKPGLKKEKPSELQISEVYRIVSLIQKVNCSTFALVTETASELGIKKTVLMQYIEDNPKLFDVTKATSKSAKEVVKNPATGKSLDNTMNIYSIKGNSGVLTLGTEGRVSASTVSTNTNLCFPTSVWK